MTAAVAVETFGDYNQRRLRQNTEANQKSRLYFKVGRLNAPKIIFNGNSFNVNKKKVNSSFWRCDSYWRSKCTCTVITRGGQMYISGDHNHEPNALREDFSQLKSQFVNVIYRNKRVW
ncbi:uncharacterized protein [Leptinotarsa decemlineata]|uniref:uncharacterized protein n=1 Tax=Leptinotarsa decemlineata TaxID=7539 RepID=UPI003D30486E